MDSKKDNKVRFLIRKGGTVESTASDRMWVPRGPLATYAVYNYKGLSRSASAYVPYDISTEVRADITLYA